MPQQTQDAPPRRPIMSYAPVWMGVGGLALLLMGFIALMIAADPVAVSEGETAAEPDFAWWRLGLGLVCCVGALWFHRSIVRRRWARRSGDELSPRRALTGLPIGAAAGVALASACVLAIAVLGGIAIEPAAVPPAAVAIAGLVGLNVVVAVFEELLFRGILLEGLRERLGWAPALVISAVVFGAGHGDLWGAVTVGLEAGVLLGAVFLVTRSLWIVIGAHAAWNATIALLGAGQSAGDGSAFLTVRDLGPALLSGGAAGTEGSVVTVAISLAVSTVLLVVGARTGRLGAAFGRTRVPDGQVAGPGRPS